MLGVATIIIITRPLSRCIYMFCVCGMMPGIIYLQPVQVPRNIESVLIQAVDMAGEPHTARAAVAGRGRAIASTVAVHVEGVEVVVDGSLGKGGIE